MDQLRALVLASLSAPAPFDAFQDLLDHACDTLPADGTAHSISDLRLLTTKHKGDLWELFCRQYLLHVHGCSEAWLLRDVPADVLTRLSMRRADLGIDLVALKGKETLAVQCKWRQPQRFKIVPGTRTSCRGRICRRSSPSRTVSGASSQRRGRPTGRWTQARRHLPVCRHLPSAHRCRVPRHDGVQRQPLGRPCPGHPPAKDARRSARRPPEGAGRFLIGLIVTHTY